MTKVARHRKGREFSNRWRWLFWVPAWAFLIMACQTPGLVLENRLPLVKNKPYEGTQQSMDYQLAYRYTFREGTNSGPGTIDFSGKLVPRRGLDTFILRLHMLNAAGDVVATHVLYSPGAGNSAARSSISKQIEVPADTESIAFSHVARDQPIFP